MISKIKFYYMYVYEILIFLIIKFRGIDKENCWEIICVRDVV